MAGRGSIALRRGPICRDSIESRAFTIGREVPTDCGEVRDESAHGEIGPARPGGDVAPCGTGGAVAGSGRRGGCGVERGTGRRAAPAGEVVAAWANPEPAGVRERGASHLMQSWDELFEWHDLVVAQVLLTRRDLRPAGIPQRAQHAAGPLEADSAGRKRKRRSGAGSGSRDSHWRKRQSRRTSQTSSTPTCS